MRSGLRFVVLVLVAGAVALPAAADPVMVTILGEVEYNQISAAPLGKVSSGDPVTLSFAVDSAVFMDSANFPVRGYEINPMSFALEMGPITMGLQDPFPAGQTPWFVIRDNDPAVDGFFLSALTIDFPLGIPISQTGIFEQFKIRQSVTYVGDTLSSLDILDAVGTYDFTGLTVFGFAVADGPFDPLGIVFESLTIEAIPVDEDGDGVLDDDDLCPGTVIAEGVPTNHLGINRWALTDDDLTFDSNVPPGGGPGYMFDTADTGGCSCEQIIVARGLGEGHRMFGCSNGVMLGWVNWVAGAGYDPGMGDGGPGIGGLSSTTPVSGTLGLATDPDHGSTSTTGDAAADRFQLSPAPAVEERRAPRARKRGSRI